MRNPPVAGALLVKVTMVPAGVLLEAAAVHVCAAPDDQAAVLQPMTGGPVVDQFVWPATGLTCTKLNVSAVFTKE